MAKNPKCACTDYNGGQCYNCLNGAHDICKSPDGCKTLTAYQQGIREGERRTERSLKRYALAQRRHNRAWFLEDWLSARAKRKGGRK